MLFLLAGCAAAAPEAASPEPSVVESSQETPSPAPTTTRTPTPISTPTLDQGTVDENADVAAFVLGINGTFQNQKPALQRQICDAIAADGYEATIPPMRDAYNAANPTVPWKDQAAEAYFTNACAALG